MLSSLTRNLRLMGTPRTPWHVVFQPFIDFLSPLILHPGWVSGCVARFYAITSSHNMNFKGIDLLWCSHHGTTKLRGSSRITRLLAGEKFPVVFSVMQSKHIRGRMQVVTQHILRQEQKLKVSLEKQTWMKCIDQHCSLTVRASSVWFQHEAFLCRARMFSLGLRGSVLSSITVWIPEH